MPEPSRVPATPIAFIQNCVRRRRILWTYHVNMRMKERSIARSEILAAVGGYELVEAYPDDKYLPSFLILARSRACGFHVLFAADVPGDNVRVVTAYRPDDEEWLPDLKTRRRRR